MGARMSGEPVSASVRVFARVLAGSEGRRLSAPLHDLVVDMKPVHDPARVRVVKLMSVVGTTQLWSGGQPASVEELRHREMIAGLICAAVTTPFRGSA